MQTRAYYGAFRFNIEFRAKAPEAQRDSVTCVRSQSESAAKTESKFGFLKWQTVCFLETLW